MIETPYNNFTDNYFTASSYFVAEIFNHCYSFKIAAVIRHHYSSNDTYGHIKIKAEV